MMKLAHCAAHSGLASKSADDLSVPSKRLHRLLSSYLLNRHRGAVAVKEMIDRDRRFFLDLGAKNRASELEAALSLFISRFPEAQQDPA